MATTINNPAIVPFDKGIRDVDALPTDNIDADIVYRLTDENARVTLWRYEEEAWYEQVSFFDVSEAPTDNIEDGIWYRVKLDNAMEYYVSNDGQMTKYIDVDIFDAELARAWETYEESLSAKDEEIAKKQANNEAELAAKDAEKEEALAAIETEKQESIQAIQLTYDVYLAELISGSGTEEFAIPDGATNIADYTFYGRQYVKIVVPSSVTSVGEYAFASCSSCLMFDFSALTAIPTIENVSAFDGILSNAQIVVTDDLYDSWITAENWAQYSANIIKASEVTVA